MVAVHIGHIFTVCDRAGRRIPPDELHRQGERLMEALLDLEKCNDRIADPATSTDAANGTVTAELLVTADTEAAAFQESLTVVRTAIHAVNGATAGWQNAPEAATDFRPVNAQLDYV